MPCSICTDRVDLMIINYDTMRIQIIIAFATIAVCLFGLVIQLGRLARAIKEYKVCKQEIDELIKEIDDEDVHE